MWAVIQEKGMPFLSTISKGSYAQPCLAEAGYRKMACYMSGGITTHAGWLIGGLNFFLVARCY
jgi:hypothetical protein